MLVPWEILAQESEESHNLVEKLLEIAAADPLILSEIMRGILHEEPSIKIQAAAMVEKVMRVRPSFLTPYKGLLLNEFSIIKLPEVRQQVAVLYGRVMWDEWELKQVVALLSNWIDMQEDEQIVINAMESLYKLAMQKDWIFPKCVECFKKVSEHTNPTIKNLLRTLSITN